MSVFDMIMSPGIYAITGGAGAGKSSLAHSMKDAWSGAILCLDSYFIGDSAYRAHLLESKEHDSWDSYVDACNQMNWWDWQAIDEKMQKLYDEHRLVFVEGAILGPEWMWPMFTKIIYIDVPSAYRLERIINRDNNKRDGLGLAHRFLITEYSEQLHYRKLLPYAEKGKKLVICDLLGNQKAAIENKPSRLYLPKGV